MKGKNSELSQIIYQLSKKTLGTSNKLLKFFGLDLESYSAVYPLTKLQEDIYLDTCINPDTLTYNIGPYVLYDKPLNLKLWTRALNLYVNDNDAYRTSIIKKDDLVYQCVRKSIIVTPVFYDLSEEHLTTEELNKFIRDVLNEPYSIQEQTMVRHFIIKLSDNQHAIGMGMHQIALDGISGRLYFENISSIYLSLLCNQSLPNLRTSKSFADYVFDNNDTFNLKSTIDFWKEELANCTLPSKKSDTIRPKTQLKTFEIGEVEFEEIKAFCWKHKITPPFYLKCLFTLLLRYVTSPETDFLIFENRHGRKKEYLDVPGIFLYSQPSVLRESVFQNTSTFQSLIDYFRSFRTRTSSFQNISMKEVLNLLYEKEGIRCFFNYLKYSNVEFLGEKATIIPFESAAPDELHFFVEEKPESLFISLFYSADVFDYNHFLERFAWISSQFTKDINFSLADIDYVLPMEKSLLEQFSSGTITDRKSMFVDLFEMQVQISGSTTAVKCSNRSLSYDTLNNRANKLARHLQRSGINKGDIVAVILDRSDLLLVSIIATLKAGCIYLPLDPLLPEERMKYMLKDSNPAVILLSAQYQHLKEKNTLVLSDNFIESLEDSTNLSVKTDPKDPAYLIYTSGSTGMPKGCVIHSEAMINHLMVKADLLKVNNQSSILQNASIGFDISIWQFLTALLRGGQVHIYSTDIVEQPLLFLESLREDQITIVQVVPSYLKLLLSTISRNTIDLPHLEFMIVTGEELKTSIAQSWFNYFPTIKLINAYGPTEAADDVTHYVMSQTPNQPFISIGTPIANISINVMNGRSICPPGVKGEICLSGMGVGLGYLNQPELTHQAFVDNLVVSSNGGKLYKSGDIGSWDKHGLLLYHGRRDAQIKIHGHRIELSEIENLLQQYERITEVVVLSMADHKDISQIVAFYSGEPIDSSDLTVHLNKRLPNVVVPSTFHFVESFPLTSNGKIDKRALLKLPEVVKVKEHEEPKSEDQKILVAIWEEVLDKENIGINSNFFKIGGHSLLAMQTMQIVRERFKLNVPLKVLFDHNTVKKLAAQIDNLRKEDTRYAGENEEFVI